MSRLMDKDLVVRVLGFFPAIGVLRGVETGGGTAGRNMVLIADGKKYFFRGRNPKYSTEQEIVYDHSLLKYLAGRGIPVPLPLVSSEGKTWLRMDELVYELYEYIPGRRFNSESILDLQNVAKALARYHVATAGFTPQGAKPRAEKREDHPTLIRPILEEMQKAAKGAASRTVTYLMDQLLLVQERIPDNLYLQLPQLVIHGDFHPANIIFGYDDKIYFTDFDWASMQAKAVDIADGLAFFAARRVSPINGGDIVSLTQTFEIDILRSKTFLNAYREICEVSDDEIEALPWLVKSRWIETRAKGGLKVPEGKRLQYLVDGAEKPLRWLDKWENKLVKNLK